MIDNIPRLLSGIYNSWDVVFHENASKGLYKGVKLWIELLDLFRLLYYLDNKAFSVQVVDHSLEAMMDNGN